MTYLPVVVTETEHPKSDEGEESQETAQQAEGHNGILIYLITPQCSVACTVTNNRLIVFVRPTFHYFIRYFCSDRPKHESRLFGWKAAIK